MSTPGGALAAHLAALAHAPEAFARGLAGAREVALPFPAEAVRNVAICGMGAAGEAGSLVLGALGERVLMPTATIGGYTLPGWVDQDTLVILLSVSGSTEETLTCASLATERNALCVAVTGGGKLGTHYAGEGVPVVPVPADGPVGSSTIELIGVVLGLLDRMGVAPLQPGEVDEAGEVLAAAVAACADPGDQNPARALTEVLEGRLPYIWGGELTAAVGRRWASRMWEWAGVPARVSELPHLNHDEMMSLPALDEAVRARLVLVLLRDARQQRQVQRRFEHTAALVGDLVAGTVSLAGDGRGPIARMLDLVVLGDHLALHLAHAAGVQPG
ncbi:MAG: SIS domain-containing protein, partial [Miltoncostaeaceae bacterium]